MAESDEDITDISKVLLESGEHDADDSFFSFSDTPSAKRRKTAAVKTARQNIPSKDLDLFPNEVPFKSKLTGSSFKNMGF
jgi:hypothetical protein